MEHCNILSTYSKLPPWLPLRTVALVHDNNEYHGIFINPVDAYYYTYKIGFRHYIARHAPKQLYMYDIMKYLRALNSQQTYNLESFNAVKLLFSDNYIYQHDMWNYIVQQRIQLVTRNALFPRLYPLASSPLRISYYTYPKLALVEKFTHVFECENILSNQSITLTPSQNSVCRAIISESAHEAEYWFDQLQKHAKIVLEKLYEMQLPSRLKYKTLNYISTMIISTFKQLEL